LAAAQPRSQLAPSAFSPEEKDMIRAAIRRKYAAVSSSAAGYFAYAVGKEGAERLGYAEALLAGIPADLMTSFCGVGNPFALAPIEPGSTILDIGCGAGFDVACAVRLTGASGRVHGVDLSPEMLERARANLAAMAVSNAEVSLISSEALPFSDGSFDTVISNGVINLSPDKPLLFAEIYRVLKPAGRLQFADVVLEKELPAHLAAGVESWSQ
jgi:SAM-dependent methyltransferase